MGRSDHAALHPTPVHADALVHCPHAEQCGGCPAIGMSYGEQLGLKRGRVVHAVARYPSLEFSQVAPVAPADDIVEYRTRAKLIVAAGGHVGLYAKGGGHLVVDIPECRVLAPAIARVAQQLRAHIARDEARGGPLTPLDGTSRGSLRAVDLREVLGDEGDTPRVLVTFVVQESATGDRAALVRAAADLAADAKEISGVAVNYHGAATPQILGASTALLYGDERAKDRIGTTVYYTTFGSFVQAHRGQASRVHQLVADALLLRGPARDGAAKRVLDLYAGSGAIGIGLARAGASVHLVESFAPAIEQARAAAAGLRVTVECSDAASALGRLAAQHEAFDGIVVNPPRRGTSSLAREALGCLGAKSIVYVSCDPDTLARDLDHLTRLGYAAARIQPVDMIPLTDEVETVALLRRVPTPPATVVYEEPTLVVVEKGPHEPTAPQAEYRVALRDRVGLVPGLGGATAVYSLDVSTSGLVPFAREPAALAGWSQVFANPSTRIIFVAAVRGITATKGTITRSLRERGALVAARTRYRRLAVVSGHSMLRIVSEELRPHQLRRHLAGIGHPVLGDARYGHGPTNRHFEERHGLDRAFVHCVRVEFDHPTRHERVVIEAPLPGDLRGILERIGGEATLNMLEHKHALGSRYPSVSSAPPPPDSNHHRGIVLELDGSPVSEPPETPGEDADDTPSSDRLGRV